MLSVPRQDWQWLVDVHKVDITGAKVIVLHGSEDGPTKIEVFGRDHYQAIPLRIYERNEEHELVSVPTPVALALDEEDFFGLRWVCTQLFDDKPMTPDRRRDLANKMHEHLHKAIHVGKEDT